MRVIVIKDRNRGTMFLVMKSLNTTIMRMNSNLVFKLCRRFLSEGDSYLHGMIDS